MPLKTLKRGLILTLIVFAAIPAATAISQDKDAAPAHEKVFNAQSYMLDNGLQVVVISNHRVPVVTHMVWYKTGAADEPPGTSGIAHFLEHLMFKGSDGLKPGEFSKIVRALGGEDNAFTSQDYTAYFQSVAKEHLETVMKMEAGRMRGLAPPLKEVESERLVILEERRQRTDNEPREKLNEQINASLYINHPYGVPVIGWYHEMEQLTWDDAKAFYDRWYGPNNAILIVSGDVEGREVLALAQKIYGPLQRVPVPERHRPQIPNLIASTTLTLSDDTVRQPLMQSAWRVPSYRQNPQESLALQVMIDIIGAGPTSRVYKSLVIEKKLATNAGLYYREDALDTTSLWAYVTPAPGIDPQTAMAALYDELRKLIKDGVSADELKRSVQRMQDSAVFARDSVSGPAMIIGQALATGSTLEQIETWPEQLDSVTAVQIQEAAKAYLDPDKTQSGPPVSGILLPAANATPEMAPEKQPEEQP